MVLRTLPGRRGVESSEYNPQKHTVMHVGQYLAAGANSIIYRRRVHSVDMRSHSKVKMWRMCKLYDFTMRYDE